MPSSEQERFAAAQARNAVLETRSTRIRELNDEFRRTSAGGVYMLTAGVQALGSDIVGLLLNIVRSYVHFDENNDPHGEHDFGTVDGSWGRAFWKIDYYNLTMDGGASDPSNPDITMRVLTIMLASEY